MPEPMIQIQGLSKRYTLGEMRPLAARLADAVRRLTGRGGGADDDVDSRELWALRDINMRVEAGEVVGIIGRNGAGKSTLLKILSRITDPTQGHATMRGRVASLLEVGTGFHPELTGRENIYLNGAILGMRRREVRSKLSEIVEFSGVERFLDTPVKRYSSGMRVRLAFAVAAHLEPEILIIDEVLAVGDAAFQSRCLGKMRDLASGRGRTVLFVSHNMLAIQTLCDRTAWLDRGRIRDIGDSTAVLGRYLTETQAGRDGAEGLDAFRADGMTPIVRQIRLLDGDNQPTDQVLAGHEITVEIAYQSDEPLRNASFGIGIDTSGGQRLIFAQTTVQHGAIEWLPRSGVLRCRVPRLPLTSGEYTMSFGVSAGGRQLDGLWRAVAFRVQPWDVYGSGRLPQCGQGPVLVDAAWTLPVASDPNGPAMKEVA